MKHYFYIVVVVFWYLLLFIRHGFVMIHLKFEHYKGQFSEGGKGITQSTKSRKIYTTIDVDAHNSFADIRNTVCHEYRHAKQHKTLDLVVLVRDQLFRKNAPKDMVALSYYFSLLEIDARYYEQYKKWLPLEEIPQKVLAKENRGFSYGEACILTAVEYNVHKLPNAEADQDILPKK